MPMYESDDDDAPNTTREDATIWVERHPEEEQQ